MTSPDLQPNCRQCEMFILNEGDDDGWCCEFGEARKYGDRMPEKCIPRGDEQ